MRLYRAWGWCNRHGFATGPNGAADPVGGILFCTIVHQIAPMADTPPRIWPNDFRLANTARHQATGEIHGDLVDFDRIRIINPFRRTKLCDRAAGRRAGLCPVVYMDTPKLALIQ